MSTSNMEPPGVSLMLVARRGIELVVVVRGMIRRGDGGGEKSFIVRRVDDEIWSLARNGIENRDCAWQ